MCHHRQHVFLPAPNTFFSDVCCSAPSGSKSTTWAVKQSLTTSLDVCCLHIFMLQSEPVDPIMLHISSHILEPIMWHTSFPKVWTCCWQCLIQPGQLFPCSRSVSVNTGFLFGCFSPAQLFAVAEALSISQAASCLIDELLQGCDSHTLAHGFFCFSFHICKKLHFLPFSFHFCFYFWVTVCGGLLFLYQNAKWDFLWTSTTFPH